MSIDKKTFGLSDSLVQAVNEALKGGQKKLDKNHNGKLDSQDFKMLRKEDAADLNTMSGKKKTYSTGGQAPVAEVADGNKTNFKQNMKEGPEEKDKTNPKQGSSVDPKQRSIGEAAAVGAPVPNMAAAMDARKSEVQRKIAQKQAAFQQSNAKKRIAGTMKEASKKCGCTEDSKCADHDDKTKKGGKEPIEINPPLKEASDLPKKVVSKGHEIAKSLLKHRSGVKNAYAVGMATAKKSAGIKEDAEQVDELSKKTKISYAMKADKQVVRTDAGYGKRHGGLGTKGVSTNDFVRKYKNRKAGIKQAMKD